MTATSRNVRLTPEDIRACVSPQAVHDVFARLSYQVQEGPPELRIRDLQLRPSNEEAIASAYLLADHAGRLQVLLCRLRDSRANLRSLADDFVRRGGHYLLVTTSDFQRLTFVNPRRVGIGKVKVHKLVVERARPTRHDLDVLNNIVANGESPDDLYAKQCKAFDVEAVTNRFHREYARLFRVLQEAIKDSNKGVADFYDPDKLHAFTQRLLGRVMFLYFLQKKGWLADDPNFLTKWYRRCLTREGNFYREILEPLFFETLNRLRPNDESPWGNIPYLNGGLFEKDYDCILQLDNGLFDDQSSDGVLGFFNSYSFTVEEDTPLELEVALDPEMLGKVFENLLEEQERGQTGTFYTPRPIVHYMCRESLLKYLEGETSISRADLAGFFEEDAAPALALPQVHGVEVALDRIRMLDPAVGSGAFLVGMLQELVQVRLACLRAQGVRDVDRHGAYVARWKREFIQKALYGVDIKAEAIEIAKLRLWLSLVVDLDRSQVEPLPNLDYKLMVGNSLIDTIDGEPILRRDTGAQLALMADAIADVKKEETEARHAMEEARQELRRLHDEYFSAEPDRRAELRRAIHQQEAKLLEAHVGTRLAQIQGEVDRIGRQAAEGRGQLGKRDASRLNRLTQIGSRLQSVVAGMRKGESLPFFLYEIHFADVFAERGGFDVVIANPPYVSAQGVEDLPYVDELERRFGWKDDLYVHFAFRALELPREGGIVTFITSDSYQAIPTKQRLRDLLLSKRLAVLSRCEPFEQTVDNAVFIAANETGGESGVTEFIQGRAMPSDTYGGLTVNPDWSPLPVAGLDGGLLVVENDALPRYAVPQTLYDRTWNRALFEPSPRNLELLEWFAAEANRLHVAWWEKVRTSETYRENRGEILEYLSALRPGDITLFGLVAEGGQGLATADNSRFLGYLEGTPEANAALARRSELEKHWAKNPAIWAAFQSALDERGSWEQAVDDLRRRFHPQRALGLRRGEVYRIVPRGAVANLDNLPPDANVKGLPGPRIWVPYRKGDPEGHRWISFEPLYINWSKDNVAWLMANSGKKGANMPVVRNPHLYLREGLAWSRIGRDVPLKVRLQAPSVFDPHASQFSATGAVASAPFLLAILNTDFASYYIKTFLNNTHYEINSVKALPIVVPAPEQHEAIAGLARQAVDCQRRILTEGAQEQARLAEIEAEINRHVEELYGARHLGPFPLP